MLLPPNTSCECGRLLTCLAKPDEHAPLIQALLEHGADREAKEVNGKSARETLRAFYDYDLPPKVNALIEQP